jgi:prevent-host-death family protein
MRFSTDEIKPFYEVRQNLSKAIDEVERDGGEVVIAKHGKPVAALLSAAGLYRYREVDRLMVQLLDVLAQRTEVATQTVDAQITEIADHIKALGESTKSGGKA